MAGKNGSPILDIYLSWICGFGNLLDFGYAGLSKLMVSSLEDRMEDIIWSNF